MKYDMLDDSVAEPEEEEFAELDGGEDGDPDAGLSPQEAELERQYEAHEIGWDEYCRRAEQLEEGAEGQGPGRGEEDPEPPGGVPMTEEEFERITEPLTAEEEAELGAESRAASGQVEARPEVRRFDEGTTKRLSGPRAAAHLKASRTPHLLGGRGYFDYPSMRHGR